MRTCRGTSATTASSSESVPCAICGGTRTRTLYTKFGHDIGRCVQCGLVYANPRAAASTILGRYSSEYFWNEYLPALGVVDGRYDLAQFDTRYSPLLRLLDAAPGRRLLEVGSGAGFFLKAAERAGWRATGVELSAEATEFARERLGLDVRRASKDGLTLESRSFDATVMFDTIEHLIDPRAVIESVHRALVPGGLLIVSTPNFTALSRWLLGQPWAVISPLEHLYYFEEHSLRRLLTACGFRAISFVRRHPAWTPQQTLNFRYTQAPNSWRARASGILVRAGGRPFARMLQRTGRQDILLCLATVPR